MYIEFIGGFVIILLYLLVNAKQNKNYELIKDKFQSMEKIDTYLDNIILKKDESKKENTRLKKCFISENIINIEKQINKY